MIINTAVIAAELLKFNGVNGFMKVSSGEYNQPPNATHPGARWKAGLWLEASTSSLFLFGGGSRSNVSGTPYSDLWKYSIGTSTWTLLRAGSTVLRPGTVDDNSVLKDTTKQHY